MRDLRLKISTATSSHHLIFCVENCENNSQSKSIRPFIRRALMKFNPQLYCRQFVMPWLAASSFCSSRSMQRINFSDIHMKKRDADWATSSQYHTLLDEWFAFLFLLQTITQSHPTRIIGSISGFGSNLWAWLKAYFVSFPSRELEIKHLLLADRSSFSAFFDWTPWLPRNLE